jgi:hypothetical protein
LNGCGDVTGDLAVDCTWEGFGDCFSYFDSSGFVTLTDATTVVGLCGPIRGPFFGEGEGVLMNGFLGSWLFVGVTGETAGTFAGTGERTGDEFGLFLHQNGVSVRT